jgi:AraC family transcriptional regulator of adaptative response / DNA-3-methyladenine glycosylase II
VLGQQVSAAAARTLAGRLVGSLGEALPGALAEPDGPLTHLFPVTEAVAGSGPGEIGLPAARHGALVGLAWALERGEISLDAGVDRDEARRRLLTLKGIGPWTASYVDMRALGDPDAFLPGDLGIRRASARLGLPESTRGIEAVAARWRPWRSYAAQHLWASLEDAPTEERERREETVA